MPNLLEFPGIVLLNILEKLDIRSICVLRKVCRDLRNLIDDVKPNFQLNIKLHIHSNGLLLFISTENSETTEKIRYMQHVDGCLVVSSSLISKKPPPIPKLVPGVSEPLSPIGNIPYTPPSSIHIENTVTQKDKTFLQKKIDFCEVFLTDLNTLLKFPIIQFSISVAFPEFDKVVLVKSNILLDSIGNLLSTTQINYFLMMALTPDNFIRIFPKIHDRKMVLRNLRPQLRQKIDFKEIMKLENWKKIESFKCSNFVFSNFKMRNFCHLKNLEVVLDVVKWDDLVILKEEFLRSTIPQSFKIEYEKLQDDPEQPETFGSKILDGKWSFSVPKSSETSTMSINSHAILLLRNK